VAYRLVAERGQAQACQAMLSLLLKKKGLVYLRFLNSMSPSGVVVMYSNPTSMSFVASLVSLAVLHVHSLESLRNIAFSRLM